MKTLRSFLFIPSDKKRMLNKIGLLSPDAFILDLEDSVSPENKEQARNNIADKLKEPGIEEKTIFVRVNDIGSGYIYDDINMTISRKLEGYVIPKFENIEKLKEIFKFILKKENEVKIQPGSIKIILMVESSKGLLELNKIKSPLDRIIGLALGAEDYLFSLSGAKEISGEMVDFARKIIITYSKSNNFLSIDTVYRDYKNNQGLKDVTGRVAAFGFTSKFAIHPEQINIINSSFTPTKKEVEKAKIILNHKKDIEKKGAISIDGVMYDPPHLKWAKKITDYMDNIGKD